MSRKEKIKKLRLAGLALMILGTVVAVAIFTTKPVSLEFQMCYGLGTLIFMIGSLMFFGYEAFVPEFWKGVWAPGPGHEYPPEAD